jgi:fatty acid synthase subunit beta
VCILQGPVAVRHSKIVNEPVKDILGNVEKGLIKRLLERYYNDDESKVPVVEYLSKAAPALNVATLLAQHNIATSTIQTGSRIYKVADSVPQAQDWLELLAGPKPTWLRALLRSVSTVQGRSYADNPIARMLTPRKGQTVEVGYSAKGQPTSLTVRGAARSFGNHDAAFKAIEITKDVNSPLINVHLFEERLGESVALLLQFHYRPDQPFALIHEVMEGRNDRIKAFYWQLWFHEEIPTVRELSSRKEHTSPMATLDSNAIIRFCQIVENRSEAFHLRGMAPMDFAIVAGWQGIMQALIASTDADLLSLVHLSNSFKLVEGASPLRANDECSAKASIQSIKISDTGKTVAVRGVVLRKEADGSMKAVIEVVSSFFFRGRFKDFNRCFETVSNEYQVLIKTPADVSVLRSKEWFTWTHNEPLKPDMMLEMHTLSDMRFKDSTSFSAVEVEGTAYIRDFKDDLLAVGEISYSADSVSYGNPVVEYIKRIGGSSSGPVALENGYSLVPEAKQAVFKAPASNEPYSKVSGDFNPIHVNPYFSQFASLPSTITHGLFTSAATRRYVEDLAAEGHPERCLSFEANFLGMVSPGDELQVKLRHIAMRAGNKVVKVETFNQHGDKVLEGQAEIAQPPTVYVFTGQGSQSVGMGMDLYNSSETARALWDEADAHLKETMGFSILEIVNKNPLTKIVHFGGVRGLAIRDRYMAMTYESTDEQGNVIPMPLFPEITSSSQSYTFSHPQGLLNATHFTQPALVLTELSAFRDMQRRGLIVEGAPFCGHSLGEYAAIAGAGSALDIKDLCDIVFLRGLTMQRAVRRDEQGRSDYGMVACNAARVGLSDQALMEVVYEIAKRPNCFLEPINFNVTMVQTVVAGNLVGLRTLQLTLDKIAEFA